MRARWWLVGLAIAGLIVILLAPLASTDPDGLERVAEDRGFLEAAQGAVFELLPDYTVPGVDDATATTIAAGLIGLVLVFILMWGLGILLTRGRRRADQEPS
jgi:hypothetical protein